MRDLAGRRKLLVRAPGETEVVSSSVMSGSPGGRANSSSALISSHCSFFSPRLRPHAHEVPAALEPLAVEREVEMALGVARVRIAIGSQRPRSHTIIVPPPYSPFGMTPSKVEVFERMVLGVDRQALLAGNEARAARTAQLFSTPSSSSRRS